MIQVDAECNYYSTRVLVRVQYRSSKLHRDQSMPRTVVVQ